jgi:DNA repair protein RecN (Recombination protein N)
MLHELRIENLLLIDRAELRLTPGLNVVTGETGAGKTLLAQSLDLLLGGRAGSGVVRGGAAEAYVEGVFSLPPELSGLELLPDGAEEIVLARRVWPDGRTRAYVCGRSATVADLRELGSALFAFYGQHEHRRLMLSAVQLDVLGGW